MAPHPNPLLLGEGTLQKCRSGTARQKLKTKMDNLVLIKNLIYEIRGQKVMLDFELAELYEVETRILNQAVKRNQERFPEDFVFQLTSEEWEALRVRSQIVISPKGGGRQYLPYAFTEQGVAMLSGVLRSKRAVEVNIQIMRTFVRLRQWALDSKEFGQRLLDLEKYFMEHCKDNDTDIRKIYEAIDLLMDRTKPGDIGFKV